MAYLLPNLSHQTILLHQSKDNHKPPLNHLIIPLVSQHNNNNNNKPASSSLSVSSSLSLSLEQAAATPAATVAPQGRDNKHNHRDDFFVNVGLAVRTLRQDLPLLFSKELNYHIYRDDITFVDPLNTFTGIEQYKLIFWALRFHGRILFRDISLQVLRIWQPSENLILIRWNLRGIPRVPWEAKGEFQGTSRYKLDRKGKIYEHKVDNLAFSFPQPLKPAASVLDLVAASCPTTPNPTFLWGPADVDSSSWVEFYRAVKGTLDRQTLSIPQDCLVATCS